MIALLHLLVGAMALLGAPLFIVISLGTLIGYSSAEIPPSSLFAAMGAVLDKPHLLPIVLFIFSGYLLAHSGTPRRAVRLAEALFGFIPGGLAIVAVITCAFFTSFTGASGVTIIAIGGLLYPVLLQRGYPQQFNLGVLTASGSLGLLFFPSLPVFMVATIYSLSAGTVSLEPEGLFAAGLVPGLLMVLALSAWAVLVGAREGIPTQKVELSEVLAAAKGAIWEALLPVFVVVAFKTGVIGIHDVATFLTVYVIVMEVFLYRDIHLFKDMPKLIREAMALVGAIFVILVVVLGMNNYLKDQKIPELILGVVQGIIGDSPLLFLLALNVLLLIVGCLMDVFSAIVAVLPLLIPLAAHYNIHPLHLCIIFLANLEIGYLTPPVGLNLFISAFQFRKPVLTVYKAVVPAIGILLVCLGLITYVPSITLAVPRYFGYAVAETAGGTESGVPISESDELIKALEMSDEALEADDEELEDWERELDEE